jgi:hypothetical protein
MIVKYLIVSEFQSVEKKYKKTVQGVTELTGIHGEIFGDIIWRLKNSAIHCRVTFSLINAPKKWRIFDLLN